MRALLSHAKVMQDSQLGRQKCGRLKETQTDAAQRPGGRGRSFQGDQKRPKRMSHIRSVTHQSIKRYHFPPIQKFILHSRLKWRRFVNKVRKKHNGDLKYGISSPLFTTTHIFHSSSAHRGFSCTQCCGCGWCWSLSQLSWPKFRVAPRTSCQLIEGPHGDQ